MSNKKYRKLKKSKLHFRYSFSFLIKHRPIKKDEKHNEKIIYNKNYLNKNQSEKIKITIYNIHNNTNLVKINKEKMIDNYMN